MRFIPSGGISPPRKRFLSVCLFACLSACLFACQFVCCFRNIATSQCRNIATPHGRNTATSFQRPGFCGPSQFFFWSALVGWPKLAPCFFLVRPFGLAKSARRSRMARWAPTREPVSQGVAAPDLGTAPQEISPAATRRGSDLRICDYVSTGGPGSTGVAHFAHRAWEVLSRGR